MVLAVFFVSVATLGLGSSPLGAQSVASGERAGDVSIGAGDGSIAEGGSADFLTMRLPAGAACQGDSASDDYRVQAFLIPETVDPGEVSYGDLGPVADGAWFLLGENTDPFVNTLTSEATGDSGGLIIDIPRFRFDLFYPNEIASGDYRIGLACSLDGETTRYWDTDVTIEHDPGDQPAELRWWSSGGAASDAGTSTAGLVAAGGAAALAILLVAVLVIRRRPTSGSTPTAKELQS